MLVDVYASCRYAGTVVAVVVPCKYYGSYCLLLLFTHGSRCNNAFSRRHMSSRRHAFSACHDQRIFRTWRACQTLLFENVPNVSFLYIVCKLLINGSNALVHCE